MEKKQKNITIDEADAALTTAVSWATLAEAKGNNKFADMDVDDICQLARNASVDPKQAAELFGTSIADVSDEDGSMGKMTDSIMNYVFNARYDTKVSNVLDKSSTKQALYEDRRMSAVASASRLSPDDFQTALIEADAGDPSVLMKATERMYYN